MLKFERLLFTSALLGLVMFGCSADDSSLENMDFYRWAKTSGIEGQVFRGPIHGGPIHEGEVSEEGFGALFYVNKDNGKLVASFNSDANGFFRVALPPGSYMITPEASAPLMNAKQQSQRAVVEKGKFTDVALHFDTGLR
jgi:hypothetical protein